MATIGDQTKRSVLVIADDSAEVEKLRGLLEKRYFTVYDARTLDGAIEALREAPDVAVIFLTVGSSGSNRDAVIKYLKQTRVGARVPVIVVLEEFMEDFVAAALKAGAADFLTWPVNADELARRAGVHARLAKDDTIIHEPAPPNGTRKDTAHVGLFFTSKNGELLECNDALVKMLGYDGKDELLHTNVEETLYINSAERNKFRSAIEKKGMIKDFRVTFKQKDGRPISILISGQVVLDDAGQVVGYQGENIPFSASGPLSKGRSMLSSLFPGLGAGYHSSFSATELLGYRYEKLERLGVGSFGEVWKVRDVLNDSAPAFVAKIPIDKKLNAKFEKESRILKKLAKHNGIPGIREVIEVQSKCVLIQEFVEGKTLIEVIERELEEKEAESVIIQLLDIVAHAHQLEVIHRDIKPGNVMVTPGGRVKLLDFGAAKELRETEISSTVTGSRPYMSPEQILGKSQMRSDVWALGVVMYVLYTGMFPFFHDVEKVLMDMILELPVNPPRSFNENINPSIEEIILKCLEKNPENRYRDAGDLKKTIIQTLPDYGKKVLPLY